MKLKFFLAASASVLATAVVMPAPLVAQQITSGIEGNVTDEAGNPITGAAVTVTDTRTGASRTLTTGDGGTFVATGLTTGGPYTVSATATDFEGQTISDVETTLQGNTSLSFALSSGGGVITVNASRVQLTQLAVGPGQSFTAEVLQNTPTFNRDVRDVIRMDPRVSLDRDDGGSGQDRVSCLGGNDRGNAFTVDGITQGDVYGLNDTGFSSRSSTPLPYDAVRETQIQFAPFDVEFGNFTGCAINVVTKSGTNNYRFGGFAEYSNADMRASSFRDNVLGVTKPVPPIKPEKRWGAYLGGPVIRDRLFLFGAYEHQESGQAQDEGPSGGSFANPTPYVTVAQFNQFSEILSRVYGIDTGELVTSRDFANDRYFLRGDLQITDDHRLEVTYQRLEESVIRSDDQGLTGTFGPTITGLNSFLRSGTQSNYYSARLYSNWTDKISTELRYSRSEVTDLQDPVGGGEAQDANPIPRIVVGIANGPGATDDGALEAGPSFSRSANDLQTGLDLYRASMNIDLGNHRIKLGAEMNRAELFNLFVQNATGTLNFESLADLEQGLLSRGTGNFNTTNSPTNEVNGAVEAAFGNFSSTGNVNDAAASFRRTIYSLFAQDEWRFNDQLKMVFGLRADFYNGGRPRENPLFVQRYGFSNSTGFSALGPVIMPRLAFTYDMDDFSVFSRSQLRAGIGVFSGGDPLVWFGNAFQNNGFLTSQGTTQDAGCPTTRFDVVTNGTFTGIPQCIVTSASASAARGLGDTQSIDPDIKQPTVLRANVGFSSRLDFAPSGLLSGWDLTLDYIYSKYQNPYTIVDLSAVLATATFINAANPNGPPIGINGFTVDGRPIYRSIDPNVVGCDAQLIGIVPTPIYNGVTGVCFNTQRDDELMLTNARAYRSHIASILLSKNTDSGIFTPGGSVYFSAGYAYTAAQDRRNMFQSTAGSNYDNSPAFDRQNPEATRGFYGSKHNISTQINFAEEFFGDYKTRLGLTFIARAGRPYSLTFTGLAVFGDSVSGSDNALAYIPTGPSDPKVVFQNTTGTGNVVLFTAADNAATLDQFISTVPCAQEARGRIITRNSCVNDWYYDMDLTFSQELPGPGHFFGHDDKIKLYATVDNFLNLLNGSWNIQRRRDFNSRQDIFTVASVDSQGRYVINDVGAIRSVTPSAVNNPAGLSSFYTDNFVNVSSSVWRLKVGISYDF